MKQKNHLEIKLKSLTTKRKDIIDKKTGKSWSEIYSKFKPIPNKNKFGLVSNTFLWMIDHWFISLIFIFLFAILLILELLIDLILLGSIKTKNGEINESNKLEKKKFEDKIQENIQNKIEIETTKIETWILHGKFKDKELYLDKIINLKEIKKEWNKKPQEKNEKTKDPTKLPKYDLLLFEETIPKTGEKKYTLVETRENIRFDIARGDYKVLQEEFEIDVEDNLNTLEINFRERQMELEDRKVKSSEIRAESEKINAERIQYQYTKEQKKDAEYDQKNRHNVLEEFNSIMIALQDQENSEITKHRQKNRRQQKKSLDLHIVYLNKINNLIKKVKTGIKLAEKNDFIRVNEIKREIYKKAGEEGIRIGPKKDN